MTFNCKQCGMLVVANVLKPSGMCFKCEAKQADITKKKQEGIDKSVAASKRIAETYHTELDRLATYPLRPEYYGYKLDWAKYPPDHMRHTMPVVFEVTTYGHYEGSTKLEDGIQIRVANENHASQTSKIRRISFDQMDNRLDNTMKEMIDYFAERIKASGFVQSGTFCNWCDGRLSESENKLTHLQGIHKIANKAHAERLAATEVFNEIEGLDKDQMR